MSRSLIVVLVLAALIVGVGAFVYQGMFAPTTTDPIVHVAGNTSDAGTTATGNGNGNGGTNTADVDAGPSNLPTPPPTTVLAAARGTVQVRRGDGAWENAEVGRVLDPEDSVRAGRNAEATLRLGDGIEVRLSPRSELRVRELTDAVARVRLDEGHVTATVGEGDRVLRVQAKGSDAVAESRGGQFGVITDGRGQLAVATTTGTTKLSSGKGSVDVAAGEAATVELGDAPSAPTKVPSSLFLRLSSQAKQKTNQTLTTVEGTTTPGSVVRVGDVITTSDAKGRFAMRVPLRDGRNDLAIEVSDAAGRREDQRLPPIVVDREKPKIDADVQWGSP